MWCISFTRRRKISVKCECSGAALKPVCSLFAPFWIPHCAWTSLGLVPMSLRPIVYFDSHASHGRSTASGGPELVSSVIIHERWLPTVSGWATSWRCWRDNTVVSGGNSNKKCALKVTKCEHYFIDDATLSGPLKTFCNSVYTVSWQGGVFHVTAISWSPSLAYCTQTVAFPARKERESCTEGVSQQPLWSLRIL